MSYEHYLGDRDTTVKELVDKANEGDEDSWRLLQHPKGMSDAVAALMQDFQAGLYNFRGHKLRSVRVGEQPRPGVYCVIVTQENVTIPKGQAGLRRYSDWAFYFEDAGGKNLRHVSTHRWMSG